MGLGKFGVGFGVRAGVGELLGLGVGLEVGARLGLGVGLEVGARLGAGVGSGFGAAARNTNEHATQARSDNTCTHACAHDLSCRVSV